MDNNLEKVILHNTEASKITQWYIIQSLWSGYGEIIRCRLKGAKYNSVVVKHINLPDSSKHPRGWNTELSHLRKLKSYQVEMAFYKSWSKQCNEDCYIPKCIYSYSKDSESIIILEDLSDSGFSEVKTSVTLKDIKLCLRWLANFHATFMGATPERLWETGTYWHLSTRPDELNALKDVSLKNAANAIDRTLNQTKFKTIVHGDAKLANFCFTPNSNHVAAVDFQYVGGGCGIKDVAYFIGSCLYEEDCEKHEKELLDTYFDCLEKSLLQKNTKFDPKAIEKEWRAMFPYAWADFHRFIKGWSPGHWKINSYSERITKEVINKLKSN